ncbi:MAG: PVC-type heme-binding CxxCH protein [Candidatus Hydrogenedentota bacterium]
MASKVLGVTLALAAIQVTTFAQLAPEDTLKQLTVAEGMEITLFAAEPDLRNPTSMDIDAQGRVWVLEAANYRLFNQEMEDEKGDRIRVLEDTDGDGRCDKATTFYQDPSLQAPMSIAVLGDRVYVTQSPDIFYLEDTDGDGKADKKTILLTGFKGVDHDHAIHGIQFRADGFLYVSNGDQGLDVVDGMGTRIQAGKDAPFQAATVLRTDLEGQVLEVLASNMRNPVEPTMDSFGNVFISDNDDDGNEQTRINYVMEGGQYGYWNKGSNSRRKGNRRLDEVHWNSDQPGTVPTMLKTGFGSPTGMLAYEGKGLPKRFYRTLIHCDAGPGEVRSYRPIPKGAGFEAEVEVIVSSPDDSWFRPSDVCVAPDGSLFIADWYDAGVGGHRMVDAAQGRIYRVTRKGEGGTYAPEPINLATRDGLRDVFMSPNQARHYLAFQALKSWEGSTPLLRDLFNGGTDLERARAFWMLAQRKSTQKPTLLDALSDEQPEFRVMAVRGIARFAPNLNKHLDDVVNDPSVAVRRQLILETGFPARSGQPYMTVQIYPHPSVSRLAKLQLQYDGKDRFYREALGIAGQGHEIPLLERLDFSVGEDTWNSKVAGLTLQYHHEQAFDRAQKAAANADLSISDRESALRAIDAIGTPEAGNYIIDTAINDRDSALQPLAFHLLGRSGGDVWRSAMDANNFDEHLDVALREQADNSGVLSFVRSSHRVGSTQTILDSLTLRELSETSRIDHLRTLQSIIGDTKFDTFPTWLASLKPLLDDTSDEIKTETIAVISRLRGEETRAVLLDYFSDQDKPRASRLAALRPLAQSKQGANALLALAEDEDIPDDVLFRLSETLHASQFEDVRSEAESVLPREMAGGGESLPSLRELANRQGDPARGRNIFLDEERATCSRCHAVDDSGPDVGPNLGKIGEKLSRLALFESILDPNAAISHEYQAWIVDTKEEEGLLGYIRSEEGGVLQLVDSNGVIRRISVSDVTARESSTISVMPSGLSTAISVQELVDLVAYLTTLK